MKAINTNQKSGHLAVVVLLIFQAAFAASAATVTGNVQDAGLAPVSTNILFTPLSTPQSATGSIILSKPIEVNSGAEGGFSVILAAGNYKVTAGGQAKDSFLLAVPAGEGSYNWTALITSELTYQYPYSPRYIEQALFSARGDLVVYDGSRAARLAAGMDGQVLTADAGSPTGLKWAAAGAGAVMPDVCGFRLTPVSGQPVVTVSSSNVNVLYFTPFRHNRLSLFDGTLWQMVSAGEVSLSLSGLATNTNYDVWAVLGGGSSILLEVTAWAGDTNRAVGLAKQDGVWVKSGEPTRRYVGTFRTLPNSAATERSATQSLIWNYYNRVPWPMVVTEAADSWTYSTAAWRPYNNNTANRLRLVVGVDEEPVGAEAMGLGNAVTGNRNCAVGVGVDSVSVNSAILRGNNFAPSTAQQAWAVYTGFTGAGFHFLQMLEYGDPGATITWYGDAGLPAVYSTGLRAVVGN